MNRRTKIADRYARPPATATSSTVACRDDGRSSWRCNDGYSSLCSNSWPQYYCTLADTFAARYRKLTRTSATRSTTKRRNCVRFGEIDDEADDWYRWYDVAVAVAAADDADDCERA